MKTVVVHPQRCVGCMQCQTACAVAHSRTQTLYGAVFEEPRPAPRIHVGPGPGNLAFPNKCRHCDPAPCMQACMPAALRRDLPTGAVVVDPSRCINCGMCAMACPFGVIRYRADHRAPDRTVAVKCDNCVERQKEGRVPACVETCLVGALEFGDPNEILRDESRRLAREISLGIRQTPAAVPRQPEAVGLWRALGDAAEAVGPGG
ncbi:4Fe-4S dicluster domain-containing protein [Deferrisoma camini]|uniref:4Fe-4S dicluster domain-containing protein n=1 Tax=Deferrisoma camini TaxID=1035120 RepID=UPI00046CD027|nr:4Fe-4S dicluster domain-containing protein [Deferrisoma camini]